MRTSAQADADTMIHDAQKIQNAKGCTFGEALREACDGDVRTIYRVPQVIALDTAEKLTLADAREVKAWIAKQTDGFRPRYRRPA